MLRVAYAHKRVLLIHSESFSVPFTHFMIPNQVNWNFDNSLPTDVKNAFEAPNQSVDFLEAVQTSNDPELFKRYSSLKVVKAVSHNYYDDPFKGSDDPKLDSPKQSLVDTNTSRYLLNGHCLFQFLFTFTPEVVSMADKRTIQVYGTNSASYMAWHWRGGGQLGEEAQVKLGTHSRLAQMILGVKCVKELASEINYSLEDTPALTITDTNPIRKYIADGNVVNLVATPDVAIHNELSHSNVVDAHLPIYVDMLMLSRAKCALLSRSGLSFTAAFASNLTCYMFMDSCVRMHEKALGGIVV